MKSTLQQCTHIPKPAHRRLEHIPMTLGFLYNASITHNSYLRSLTFKEAPRIRNARLTDLLHRNHPKYHQLARRLLEAT